MHVVLRSWKCNCSNFFSVDRGVVVTMVKTGIAVGINKGRVVSTRPRVARPIDKKGVRDGRLIAGPITAIDQHSEQKLC